MEDAKEESGWKLVHGDVFRPPANHAMLFSVFVGSGTQLCLMFLATLAFAMGGLLSPANRGSLTTAFILLFVFMGSFAGYSSSRIYKMFRGTEWKQNTLMTAFLYPGVIFLIFFVLNLALWAEGSSGALPFATLFTLVGDDDCYIRLDAQLYTPHSCSNALLFYLSPLLRPFSSCLLPTCSYGFACLFLLLRSPPSFPFLSPIPSVVPMVLCVSTLGILGKFLWIQTRSIIVPCTHQSNPKSGSHTTLVSHSHHHLHTPLYICEYHVLHELAQCYYICLYIPPLQ